MDSQVVPARANQQCDHLHRGQQVLLPALPPVGHLDPPDQVQPAAGPGRVPVPGQHRAQDQHVCLPPRDRLVCQASYSILVPTFDRGAGQDPRGGWRRQDGEGGKCNRAELHGGERGPSARQHGRVLVPGRGRAGLDGTDRARPWGPGGGGAGPRPHQSAAHPACATGARGEVHLRAHHRGGGQRHRPHHCRLH